MLTLAILALCLSALTLAAILVRHADCQCREREARFNRTLGRIRRGLRVADCRGKLVRPTVGERL